jgi:hypothetical protein
VAVADEYFRSLVHTGTGYWYNVQSRKVLT